MLDFLLASREPGKLLHAFSNFRPRHAQLIELLQVQPKFWADAKPVAKTQRRVCRDAALAIDDSGDPVDRHVNCRANSAAEMSSSLSSSARCSPG